MTTSELPNDGDTPTSAAPTSAAAAAAAKPAEDAVTSDAAAAAATPPQDESPAATPPQDESPAATPPQDESPAATPPQDESPAATPAAAPEPAEEPAAPAQTAPEAAPAAVTPPAAAAAATPPEDKSPAATPPAVTPAATAAAATPSQDAAPATPPAAVTPPAAAAAAATPAKENSPAATPPAAAAAATPPADAAPATPPAPKAAPVVSSGAPAAAAAAAAPKAPPAKAPGKPAAAATSLGPPTMGGFTSGQILEGTVLTVTKNEMEVDLGDGKVGVVGARHWTSGLIVDLTAEASTGDKVTAAVLARGDVKKRIVLSRVWARQKLAWDAVEEADRTNGTITAKVVDVVKGGLSLDAAGVRAFLPASLVDTTSVADLDQFVGQDFVVRVIEADRTKARLIVSRKAAMRAQARAAAKETLGNFEVGQSGKGKVVQLTDFGAFVDFNGVRGLVHRSELGWGRPKNPSDVVKVGDEVDVRIVKVQPAKNRLGLTMKVGDDPLKTLKRGSNVEGTVTRLVDFGAFVEIGPDLEGLVHVSEMAEYRVFQPEEIVMPGEKVWVKVLKIDKRKRTIDLSMAKAAIPDLPGITDQDAEAAPAADATPAEDAAPAADEAPATAAEDAAPAADEAPATPAEDAAPAADEAPAEDAAPAADEAPAEDPAPAEDAAPAADEAPAEDAAPAADEAPATPAEDAAPAATSSEEE